MNIFLFLKRHPILKNSLELTGCAILGAVSFLATDTALDLFRRDHSEPVRPHSRISPAGRQAGGGGAQATTGERSSEGAAKSEGGGVSRRAVASASLSQERRPPQANAGQRK